MISDIAGTCMVFRQYGFFGIQVHQDSHLTVIVNFSISMYRLPLMALKYDHTEYAVSKIINICLCFKRFICASPITRFYTKSGYVKDA